MTNSDIGTNLCENMYKPNIKNIMFKRPWNELSIDYKADRLYVFVSELDILEQKKVHLYQLFKADLEKRILTKKKEVMYCENTGTVQSILKMDAYLKLIN